MSQVEAYTEGSSRTILHAGNLILNIQKSNKLFITMSKIESICTRFIYKKTDLTVPRKTVHNNEQDLVSLYT